MTTGRINQVLSEGDATLKSHHQLETEAEFNLSKLSHAEQQRAKVRYRMMDESIKTHPASCTLAIQTALLFRSISWLRAASSPEHNRCEYRVRQAYKYRSPLGFARIASGALVYLHFSLKHSLGRSPPGQPTTKLAATNKSQL